MANNKAIDNAYQAGKSKALYDLFFKPMPRFSKEITTPVAMIDVRNNTSDDGCYGDGWNDCFDELLERAAAILGEEKLPGDYIDEMVKENSNE